MTNRLGALRAFDRPPTTSLCRRPAWTGRAGRVESQKAHEISRVEDLSADGFVAAGCGADRRQDGRSAAASGSAAHDSHLTIERVEESDTAGEGRAGESVNVAIVRGDVAAGDVHVTVEGEVGPESCAECSDQCSGVVAGAEALDGPPCCPVDDRVDSRDAGVDRLVEEKHVDVLGWVNCGCFCC